MGRPSLLCQPPRFFCAGAEPSTERGAGILTWPEGNGWLTQRLAQPLGERLHAGRVVLRVAAGKHGVEVDAFNTRSQTMERWQADHCIMALPLFVAARVVENPPPALHQAAATLYMRRGWSPIFTSRLRCTTAPVPRPVGTT